MVSIAALIARLVSDETSPITSIGLRPNWLGLGLGLGSGLGPGLGPGLELGLGLGLGRARARGRELTWSEERPISDAPTSISPDRREVCPPWHSASQPRASRLVCMKGKLIAAAATEMNDIHDPIVTPRCVGGFFPCSGFVLGSAVGISRVEVLPSGSAWRPNSIETLRSMAARQGTSASAWSERNVQAKGM